MDPQHTAFNTNGVGNSYSIILRCYSDKLKIVGTIV